MTMKLRSPHARLLTAGVLAASVAALPLQISYAGAADGKKAHTAQIARVGKPAPDFTLVDQDGKERSLSDYKGKVVALEWTNPGCPFVKRHYNSGTMVKLEKKFGGSEENSLVWLRINSTNKRHQDYLTAEQTRAWAKKVGITGPVLDDSDGLVGHLYGARTTPHMFIVDAKGVLVYSGAIDNDPRGAKKPADYENYVDNILTGYASHKAVEPFANDSYGCSVKYGK